MAIVLRFVDDNNEICENWLCMSQVSKFDAVSITDAMLEYLQQYGVQKEATDGCEKGIRGSGK